MSVSVDLAFVRVEGPLRVPVGFKLRGQVEALLGGGQKSLVLDLAAVTDLDAAGVGELVYLYRRALAADADLRLVRASKKVCRLLDRAGVAALLGTDCACEERCS